MAEFKISIYERVVHTITVTAADEDAAIDQAYQAVSNVSETMLKALYDYDMDGEYMGVHEAEELPED